MRGKKPPVTQYLKLLEILGKAGNESMGIPITKGKVETAKKVVIYGPEGIGKSTLASCFPDPVFIDTEGSTKELDVARYPTPSAWADVVNCVKDCAENATGKTIVIDTADWAELLCIKYTCSKCHVEGIEDVGYGKGYVYLSENFNELLKACDKCIAAGINVVFTAHAFMRKFEQPDEMGAYDRWEMKLTKKDAPMLKEWADMVLFCNYKTNVITDQATKSKKATGGSRVMYATHHPCWDAKNRYGLPDSMPMSFDEIAHLFTNTKQPEPDYRSKLRAYMNEHGIDQHDVVSACGLSKESTNEDYKAALEYAKTLTGGN